MQATLRPRPMPYEPMTMGWRSPSSPRYSAPSAFVYLVPSLKMLPTSMPLRRITVPPQSGQASPSRTLAMSVITSGVKSRGTLTLRRWNPGRFAPATRFALFAARASTTTSASRAPIGEP